MMGNKIKVQVRVCARCGGRTQAADGTCNSMVGHRNDLCGIPVWCMSSDFVDLNEWVFEEEHDDED